MLLTSAYIFLFMDLVFCKPFIINLATAVIGWMLCYFLHHCPGIFMQFISVIVNIYLSTARVGGIQRSGFQLFWLFYAEMKRQRFTFFV
jgi:predicted membrane protein